MTASLPKPDGLLVIGYGNSLRGDDAAGPVAAQLLRERGLPTLAVHQLTPELTEPIAAARTVFFLDADAALAPGAVSAARLEPSAGPTGHHATPAALLRLARDVYGAAPAAWLISLGGANFAVGETLSPSARQAIARAVAAVLRLAFADTCRTRRKRGAPRE